MDLTLILQMIGSVSEFASGTCPDLWRRHLALVVDGLRAHPGLEPLPVPPLCEEQMAAATARPSTSQLRGVNPRVRRTGVVLGLGLDGLGLDGSGLDGSGLDGRRRSVV